MARLTITAKLSEPIRYASSAARKGRNGDMDVASAGISDSAPPRSERALDRLRREQLGQHARRDADEITASAAVDADALEREDARLDVDRQRFARGEGRGAADLVAARALRRVGRARLDALGADRPGEPLGADLPVAVHQHDQRLALLV